MEGFFEFCAKYKVVDLVQIFKDYDYNLLRRIPIGQLEAVAQRALNDRKENILFQVYVQLLGKMSKESYMSFSDFAALAEQDNRSEEDILKELEKMEKEMEGTDGTV